MDKKDNITDFPQKYLTVMIEYRINGVKKKKLGFYSYTHEKFIVPPEYMRVNGHLAPHGWGAEVVPVEDVISWEYLKSET